MSGIVNSTGAVSGVIGTTVGTPAGESTAFIGDQKGVTTDGGSATSGAWRTRDLNTEFSDTDGIVSIGSNQFTLQAGTYTVNWSTPFRNTDRAITRLYNITDGSQTSQSTTPYWSDPIGGHNVGYGHFTISGAKAYEIQYIVQTTHASNGLGLSSDNHSTLSIYTIILIVKHT